MNKKSILLIIVLLIYALITFVIMMHHEIWGDEAQAWLVSRDLDFAGIIKHVRTEGHPLLWYFVILPFAKLNLPVVSMKIINWLIVLAGAGIFMWKAPFSIFSKISVLISSAFLYWFPALARSYCLVPLLLFLLAAFYKKQKEHPYLYAVLVILLAQTHVIMFAFCCALFVLFVLENRKKEFVFSSVIIFCGLLSVFLYLCGSRAENSIVQSYHNGFSPELLNLIYKNVVFNIYNSVSVFYTVIFTAFCTFCAVLLFIKDRKLLFVWAFHHLYQFFIFVFIWGIIAQRAYTLLFVSLFCLWIIYEKFETKISKIVINTFISLTFLATLPACANIITRDWIFTFSDGKNAAEFIKNNIPENAFIMTNTPVTTAAISVYLPADKWKFYNPKYNSYYTFAVWNKGIPNPTDPLPVKEKTDKYKTIYVIMSGSYFAGKQPFYQSNDDVMLIQEKYYIYKIGDKNSNGK